jgi:hypothetical protein
MACGNSVFLQRNLHRRPLAPDHWQAIRMLYTLLGRRLFLECNDALLVQNIDEFGH